MIFSPLSIMEAQNTSTQFNRLTSQLNNFITLIRRNYRHRFYSRKCPYCLDSIINERFENVRNERIVLCSNCGHKLPSDFFRIKSHIVTLIGGTDSSKTTFITVLTEQVERSGMLNHLNTHGGIVDENGRELFQKNRNRLYVSRTTLEPTYSYDEVQKTPLVTRINRISGQQSASMFISLFDSPGEIFRKVDLLTKEHPHIGNSDAIIYLIDPLNIQNLYKEIITIKKYKNSFRDGSFDFNEDYDILNNIYEIFQRAGRVDQRGKINIPIVFCLSKSDILDPISTFSTPEEIENELISLREINDDLQYTSEEMEDYLYEYDPRLVNQVKSKFNTYAFLPVSPLGKLPQGDAIPGGPEPRGILHPIIWLLTQLKFIQ